MAWKYAVFTVMCPEFELEETAALAASLGFDGLEWRVAKRAPEPIREVSYWRGNRSTVDVDRIDAELERAKEIADRHGLAMPMLGTYLRCGEPEQVETVMRAAAAVGCGKMRVGPPAYDGARPYPELFDEAASQYERIAELARKYRVQACMEMHMGLITPSAGLAHRLVSRFDPAEIGVIFDPGNMVVEGYEHYQMGLELLGPYLSHVHAKNMMWVEQGEEARVTKWEAQAVSMRKGQADWPAVVSALKKVGYEGWISFEDFSDGDTKAKLTESLGYAKELEAAAD